MSVRRQSFWDSERIHLREALAGFFPCSSGVGSRSSTSPDTISVMRLAHWLGSRGRLGCLSGMGVPEVIPERMMLGRIVFVLLEFSRIVFVLAELVFCTGNAGSAHQESRR